MRDSMRTSRVRSLCEDDERFYGYVRTDTTDQGEYLLVARSWEHPDRDDDANILSLRYAYLTTSGGSDGWLDEGMNMRVPAGTEVGDFLQAVARLLAMSKAREENDGSGWSPAALDVVGE